MTINRRHIEMPAFDRRHEAAHHLAASWRLDTYFLTARCFDHGTEISPARTPA
jgi:hypothetical protein